MLLPALIAACRELPPPLDDATLMLSCLITPCLITDYFRHITALRDDDAAAAAMPIRFRRH